MAAWWVNPHKSNSSIMLEVSVVYSIDSLQFLLLWGPKSPYLLTSSIIATIRAWKVGLASKHVPLWFNPSLFFLNMIPYLETLAKILNKNSLSGSAAWFSNSPTTTLLRIECPCQIFLPLYAALPCFP